MVSAFLLLYRLGQATTGETQGLRHRGPRAKATGFRAASRFSAVIAGSLNSIDALRRYPDPMKPAKFVVRSGTQYGSACIATVRVEPGELIFTLSGPVMTAAQMYSGVRDGQIRTYDDPLQIGRRLFIAVEPPGRDFNHSCDPNAVMCKQSDLVAIRRIEPGEEITFDYSTTVSRRVHWTMPAPCRCGTAACRGTIGNVRTIPRERFEAYRAAGGLQDFIRDEEDARGRFVLGAFHRVLDAASALRRWLHLQTPQGRRR